VFKTPPEAATKCGEGGLFVKRLIGQPGETVHEDDQGFIEIDGKRLSEPYNLKRPSRRGLGVIRADVGGSEGQLLRDR
jgi:hypothetical protein